MPVTVNAVNETPKSKHQATYFGGRLAVYSPNVSSVRANPFVRGNPLRLLVRGGQPPVFAHLEPLERYVLARIKDASRTRQKKTGDDCRRVLREARKHISEEWRFPK